MAFSRAAVATMTASACVSAVSTGTAKERPVMKVVRMLQDMQQELQAGLEDDQKVHEELTCWCKTNDREKTAAIAEGEARSAQLESDMDGATAKVAELTAKRKATQEEQFADQKALDEAEEQRMKENKAFHAEETDLLEAIDAATYAITALSKHNANLAQVRSVATRLNKARVAQILPSSGGLARGQIEALKNFLNRPEDAVATSFLSVPGFQSYAPQSGQIFGILEQLKKDFQDSLGASQKEEAKAVSEFDMLKAAKLEEIATAKAAIVDMEERIAALKEKHAALFEEHEDVQHQLGLDQEFLADLRKKCSVSDEEFAARTKSRQEEIAAVEDTIKILNTDEMFDVSDKTVNTFLQTGSASAEGQAQRLARRKATDVLKAVSLRAALPTGDAPRLAMLAASAQLDAFTKVKEAIDKMVAELNEQNAEEIKHRDWCTAEINTNTRDTQKNYDRKANLEAKIADLKKTIETLSTDIESSTRAVADAQAAMKQVSEIREGENADYQQTVSDQRLTQMILNKALERMQQVYAFLQSRQPGAPHIATSGTATDAGNGPARFTKYEQNAGGKRIVAMLEQIMNECRAMEDEAVRSEQDAQTAYESFMKESNVAITAHQTAINNMEANRAKAKESLLMAEGDFKQTMRTLSDLNDLLNDLHNSCNYILDNFDARQAARTAEIGALREAKDILSGMH